MLVEICVKQKNTNNTIKSSSDKVIGSLGSYNQLVVGDAIAPPFFRGEQKTVILGKRPFILGACPRVGS